MSKACSTVVKYTDDLNSPHYLRIKTIFSCIVLISLNVHPDGGTTTPRPTQPENDSGIIGKDQADTLVYTRINRLKLVNNGGQRIPDECPGVEFTDLYVGNT